MFIAILTDVMSAESTNEKLRLTFSMTFVI